MYVLHLMQFYYAGQGIGNVAAGLTGGIGGCALIGQSLINAQSGGGISRLSGMSMAIFLALGIVSHARTSPRHHLTRHSPLLISTLLGTLIIVCR
jgi:SulP family sulfate permease